MGAFTPAQLVSVCTARYTREELRGFAVDRLAEGESAALWLDALDEQEAQAARMARSPHTVAFLIDSARHYELHGHETDAWIMREAVAIRIVDHPNETREEVHGNG